MTALIRLGTLAALGSCLALTSLGAYEWPSRDGRFAQQFSQTWGSGPVTFSYWQAEGPRELRAPLEGEAVYVYFAERRGAQSLPSGLDGLIVLSHADGLRTLIEGLSLSQTLLGRSRWRQGEVLGQSRQAGWAVGLMDPQTGQTLNPQVLFPVVDDPRAPVIGELRLTAEEGGGERLAAPNLRLPLGWYQLRVQAGDPEGSRLQEAWRGVTRLELFLNGLQSGQWTFDALEVKDGRFHIVGHNRPFVTVSPAPQTYDLGRVFLNQGTNILEISAFDRAGNRTARTLRLEGQRP